MKNLMKKIFAPIAVLSLALGVGLVASRETIEVNAAGSVTLTTSKFGLSGTSYATKSITEAGVTFNIKDCNVNNGLNMKASSGEIYNSTGFSGQKITSIDLTNIKFSSTSGAGFSVYGGTSAKATTTELYSNSGTATTTTTNVSFSGYEYNYFYIKNTGKRTTAFATGVVINYDVAGVTYAVSFDSDGGTPAPTSLSVSQNGTFTFPSPGTKSGYVFDGWSSDGGTTKFAAGTTSPAVTAAINYTAYWSTAPTLQSINITGTLSKTSYFTTDSWSPAGLTVTGTYSSGPTQDVTSQVAWSYNPTAPNNVSITSVTVTATLGSQTDSEIITGITVSEKTSTVVISEVYGGGGNSGAPYKNDFVELYNNTDSTINLTGLYVFYANDTGVFKVEGTESYSTSTALSGQILPRSHFLIQQAAGAVSSPALPNADLIGTIAMGKDNLKIALTNSNVAPTSPSDSNIVDFVGIGTSNMYEGTAAASAISNTTSTRRTILNGVAIDTDNNNNDFTSNDSLSPANGAISLSERIMAYDGGDLITAECATKYSTTKAQMLLLSSGSLDYFQNNTTDTKIVDARARYTAWSVANGDSTPYSAASGRNLISSNNEENQLVAVITISVLGLTAILGYYFNKKKELIG